MKITGMIALMAAVIASAADFYVSPDGSDDNAGTAGRPFATLERARDAARTDATASTIWLTGGRHVLQRTLNLSGQDSGEQGTPVVYRAVQGDTAILSGAWPLKGFSAVTNASILSRLDEAARGNVLVCNLSDNGISDYGSVPDIFGFGRSKPQLPWLSFRGEWMTLARWPNEATVKVLDPSGRSFSYTGDRPSRWTGAVGNLLLYGFWVYEWADDYIKVESIDVNNSRITLRDTQYGLAADRPDWGNPDVACHYHALNLLEELDMPGEWYLDRENGNLYFWPPSSLDQEAPVLSVLDLLLNVNGASDVEFRDIIFEGSRGNGVNVQNATRVVFDGCTIRNNGLQAIRLTGYASKIINSAVHDNGAGGISISGGDRQQLIAANNLVENSVFYRNDHVHRTYVSSISLSGVGNRAAHNLLFDIQHMAAGINGNNNIFEYNEIFNAVQLKGDAGSVYQGRNWSVLGNIIRYNFFHDSHSSEAYLDDQIGGFEIYGNVFYNSIHYALHMGGGSNNTFRNNIAVNSVIHVDARGLNWAGQSQVETCRQRLMDVNSNYTSPPWSEQYPYLSAWVNDNPGAPKNNVITCNISNEDIVMGDGDVGQWVFPENNLITQDLASLGLDQMNKLPATLKANTLLSAQLPCFEPIPFEEIGLLSGNTLQTVKPPGSHETNLFQIQGVNTSPFSPSITVAVKVFSDLDEVAVNIHDTGGRRIAGAVQGPLTRGIHHVTVENRNSAYGSRSGIFLVNIKSGHFTQTRTISVIP